MPDWEAAFDAAFATRAPALRCRAETPADAAFLSDLFVACSPLAGVLPEPMVRQQSDFQRVGYDAAYPHAMRRIVEDAGRAIGRIMIDWGRCESHLIDIAVLPDARPGRAGRNLLLAWLDIADAHGAPARLEVAIGNPAMQIYQRLGFVAAPGEDPMGPVIAMIRPVGQPDAASGGNDDTKHETGV